VQANRTALQSKPQLTS